MTEPTPPRAPQRHRQRMTYTLMATLLLLTTIALYWPVTGNDFIAYDDPDYVTDNPQVQSGLTWEGVKGAFSTITVSNWHPLTMVSHMLDCQLFGLKPWGHHLTSLLLHALNALLLFVLLCQLTGAAWRSLLVAALFAVHPLRVESVAWVAERKDVLSGCLGLLALILYARYAAAQSPAGPVQKPQPGVRSPKPGAPVADQTPGTTLFLSRLTHPSSRFYCGSLLCYALGLMSKAMLVSWPFLMLLLDYWPLERFKRTRPWRLVREKLPFFVLAAAASVLTFAVQRHEGSVVAVGKLPLTVRGANALISYCRYLGKLYWPTDLAILYPYPEHWPLVQVLLAGGLLLGISGLLYVQRRRYPCMLVGWLWFVGTLVPVIGLVQVGDQSLADRYTYLPIIGVLVLAVWGAYELVRGSRYAVMALSAAGSVAILVCLNLTRQQLGYWKDGETLFRHALAVTTNNAFAHCNLGNALKAKGQTDAAFSQYEEAVRLRPDYAMAQNNFGAALGGKGQDDEAISHYQQAIRLNPNYAMARLNLGAALAGKGQNDDAISQFRQAIRLKPDDAMAHVNLGAALAGKGQNDEAISQYQQAIRLQPANAMAHNNLGNALLRKGQTDAAISQYQEAIRLKPDYAEARNTLSNILCQTGQKDAAIRQYEETIRLKPDQADAHFSLGTAWAIKGQMDEAIHEFAEVVRLKPDYADAHYNLGTALARKGQMDEAIRQFQETIRLKPDHAAARCNLGVALSKQYKTDEAINQLQEAIRLRPDYALAHSHLGAALAEKGRIDEAISHYQEALRLKPDYAEARQNLNRALKMQAPADP